MSVWMLRHGDTEWTERGLHTGRREIALSASGREQARRAGGLLGDRRFDHVLVSPQLRARETCELAGFGANSRCCQDLVEWDYGEYEGLTDEQTAARHPGWELFHDGAPGGESPQQVAARVDRLIDSLASLPGSTLVVGHGKLLRALGARWIGCSVKLGVALPMDPAAISLLECEPSGPILRLWNLTPTLVDG